MNEGAGAEPYGYPTTNDGGDVDALLACAALADVKDAEGVMGAVVDAVQMAEEQEEAEDQWRSEMPAHAGLVDAACCKELCCRRACTQLKTRTKEIVVEMAGLKAVVSASRRCSIAGTTSTASTAARRHRGPRSPASWRRRLCCGAQGVMASGRRAWGSYRCCRRARESTASRTQRRGGAVWHPRRGRWSPREISCRPRALEAQ